MPIPLIEQWISINRVAWAKILKESEAAGDQKRLEYARWMLEEVLK